MMTFRRLNLAVSLSVAATVAGTGALSLAAALGVGVTAARAQVAAEAMPDEIVVQVAPGTALDAVQKIAAATGCTVSRSLKYLPGYYVLRTSASRSQAAQTRSRDRLGREVVSYGPPSAALLTTIDSVKQQTGVLSAYPNYISRLSDAPRSLAPIGSFLSPVMLGQTKTAAATTKKLSPTRDATPPGGRVTFPVSSNQFTPNDTYYGQNLQLDLPLVRMPEAWALQKGTGKQIVVGVVDTGIYEAHPEFTRPDGTSVIVGAENFVTAADGTVDPNAFADTAGHGTHVSGTIAAVTNNQTGVASMAGLNTNGVDVRIRTARVIGTEFGTDADIANGIAYQVANNVNVISMSLGGAGSDPTQQAIIQRALAAGIIVVASTGNDGADNSLIPTYPADYAGVLAVGSVGLNKIKTDYSNYGGNIGITAPGGDPTNGNYILSTWPAGVAGAQGYPPLIGGGLYGQIAGTSMATPHVSGAAALLLACGVKPADVVTTLERTAQLPAATYDPHIYGAGILDMYSALRLASGPVTQLALAGPQDLGSTYTRKNSIQISALVTNPDGTSTFDQTKVTVEVRAATSTGQIDPNEPANSGALLRTLVGGTDFNVPVQGSNIDATTQTITVPDPNLNSSPLILSGATTDRYKFVLKYDGVVQGSPQFIQVVTRVENKGKYMFSLPYQVRQASPTNAEQATFGTASFLLVRYNPLQSGYVYFTPGTPPSGVTNNALASFTGRNGTDPYFVFDAQKASTDPGYDIAPVGLGYWLKADTNLPVNALGDPVTDTVGINLYATDSHGAGTAGWNMIGAPFPVSIPWSSVTIRVPVGTSYQSYTLQQAVDNNILSPVLVSWNGQDYDYAQTPDGSLDPFNGYWVQVKQNCTLIVPSPGVTRAVSAAGARRSTASSSKSGWKVRIAATVDGEVDGQNYFGEATGASDGADRSDLPKPPAAGHAYVRFLQDTGNGGSRAVAYDMHALTSTTTKAQQWTVGVSSDESDKDVTLAWGGVGNAPHRTRLVIKDMTTGQSYDMSSRSSYTFHATEAGATRTFQITMSPQLSSGPLALNNLTITSLGQAGRAASGTNNAWAIRFTPNQEADVTGIVRTLTGRVVATLGGGSTRAAASTQTTLRWDGRDQSGTPLPVGTYMLELTARGTDGQTATVKRPIVSVR